MERTGASSDEQYDLIVLGAGPAGEKGAAQAAYFGKRVAVVEAREVGGALTNEATVLSKTLRETALHVQTLRARGSIPHPSSVLDLTPEDLFFRERDVVGAHLKLVRANIERHKIDLFHGHGSLVAPDVVSVKDADGRETLLRGRYILLATGSRPHRPENIPFDDQRVFDSESVLRIQRLPASLTVIGAGVIGVEYATLFAALGIPVSLVDQAPGPLPFLDGEVRDLLVARMKTEFSQIHLGEAITSVRACSDRPAVEVALASGATIESEALLYCGGRTGNSADLGLERLGIETDDRGRVHVNGDYQTSVPTVYAAGDLIGFPALAATSMEQGRVAVCHAFGFDYKKEVSGLVPYGIYTIPEVSMVGETEESLQKADRPYLVGRALYRTNPKGQILGDTDGIVKLIFDPETKRVLGVHILGDRATELVHIGQACMHFGGTIDFFIENVFNFPTLADAYKYAAYDGLGAVARRAESGVGSS